MTPTRRLEALCCGFALSVGLALGACGDLAKKRPIEADAGAGGAALDAGYGSGGDAVVAPSAGASGTNDSSQAGSGGEDESCLPGVTRCHGPLGFQRCEPDGTWGESQTCGGYSENGTSSYCAVVADGSYEWAACVDPACWWWLESGLGEEPDRTGTCVGSEEFRPCHADGILGRPQPCEGVCRVVGELDGRSLGYCERECEPGERACVVGSLYRHCDEGAWSTETQACEGGAECLPLTKGELADIKCGGPCETGTSRCSPADGNVEICNEGGEWEHWRNCLLGRCVRSGAQAQCQTECAPGERSCAFDGAQAELVCSELGLWGEPVTCDEGSVCRVGTSGALGCLGCVGPELPGGNAWGVADSRCDGDAVVACTADNLFGVPEPCASGCVQVARGEALLAYCQ